MFSDYRMCSLTVACDSLECVLLLQNVFSYYKMCSHTTECVRILWIGILVLYQPPPLPTPVSLCLTLAYDLSLSSAMSNYVLAYYRMCSLPKKCVLFLQPCLTISLSPAPPPPHISLSHTKSQHLQKLGGSSSFLLPGWFLLHGYSVERYPATFRPQPLHGPSPSALHPL